MLGAPTILLDNGAYTIKAEVLDINSDENIIKTPKLISNTLSKSRFDRRITYVGNEFMDDLYDFSGLTLQFCFQKGYLCDWENEEAIWRHILKNELSGGNNKPRRLMMTVPLFNFKSISENIIEILFENLELSSLSLMTSSILAYHRLDPNQDKNNSIQQHRLIVDSGFSFTHIIPIINGKIFNSACIRIDVGGRLLTNHLREVISYRHLNLMNEYWISNQIKEDCCYCSNDFMAEINMIKRNRLKTYYQLPNYNTLNRGTILRSHEQFLELRKTEQILQLTNEIISTPELLFSPSNIGLNQMGIAEAIYTSINCCPPAYQNSLYNNITLIGGNMMFNNITNRICNEIVSLKPDFLNSTIHPTSNPIEYAWCGGRDMLTYHDCTSYFITKSKYKELGTAKCVKYFNSLNYCKDFN